MVRSLPEYSKPIRIKARKRRHPSRDNPFSCFSVSVWGMVQQVSLLKRAIRRSCFLLLSGARGREPEQARTSQNSPAACFAESGPSRLNGVAPVMGALEDHINHSNIHGWLIFDHMLEGMPCDSVNQIQKSTDAAIE